MIIKAQDFISLAEARSISGLTRQYLSDLFHEGTLKGYSRGKNCKIFISKESLSKYMESIMNDHKTLVKYY